MFVNAQVIGLPAQCPGNSSVQSGFIPAAGLTRGAFGLTSSQTVTISVQRYVDMAGAYPVGAAITDSAAPLSVSWSDGAPCGSIQVTVTNAGGTAANLTNPVMVLTP